MFLCQLVSLLQWHDQNWSLQWASWFSSSESATKMLSMQWSIYSHRSIYQWINLSHVHLQLVSLLQWHDQNQSLQWASWFSSSESATKTLSMQWFIYFHHLIYQWIWFYVHMQIVSLLQWQVESWSLQWASWLVSLLQ